jgi:hypothetical protein
MAHLRQRNGIFFLDYVDDNRIRRRKSLHTTIKEEAQRYSIRREVNLAEAGDEFCRYAQTNLSAKTTLRYKSSSLHFGLLCCDFLRCTCRAQGLPPPRGDSLLLQRWTTCRTIRNLLTTSTNSQT